MIVDIQNEYFVGGGLPLVGSPEASTAAAYALGAARDQGIPVIHIRHENPAGSPRFAPGTRGAAIADVVAPLSGETVIAKREVDSFQGTGLDSVLRDAYSGAGAQELVVAGMMIHMCVDSLLRAATARGYRCTLLADACATRDLEWQERRVPAADVKAAFYAAFAFFGVGIIDSAAWIRGEK
jgi:nicotinamidase-related amidase